MADSSSTSSSLGEESQIEESPIEESRMEGPQMHRELLKSASCGDSRSMQAMAAEDPSILLGTTPQGNTCLHISSMHGHHGFCKDVLEREESLPPISCQLGGGITCGHASLASSLLRHHHVVGGGGGLRESILQKDKHDCNALHHAIRGGHKKLALELIAAEPALSQHVNNYNESPMFMAVMRNWQDVFERLLEIPDSADAGAGGFNALHAAVRNGNSAIAKKVMEKRPGLASQADMDGVTPCKLAVLWNTIDVLRVLLQHDCSLGYEVDSNGSVTLLGCAAYRGHVNIARELLKHYPDAPFHEVGGLRLTCLHEAIRNDHTEFVEFLLTIPQLQNLVNMRDSQGKTALHRAVQKCNPKIVAALLSHKDIDTNRQLGHWRMTYLMPRL